jgi:phosphohistidine phosphatase SixA
MKSTIAATKMTGIVGTYFALDAGESRSDGESPSSESSHPMRRLFLLSCCALVVSTVAVAQSGPTVIVLVRHAEKATAPANDPPLTEAGLARAKALAAALADADIQTIISTPTLRTLSTAKPLADARGLTIETVALGPTAVHIKAVAAAALAHRGKGVLVVGHSNTIPAIITALGGPPLAELCDTQYAMLFTVVIDGLNVRLIRGTYGTPTPDTPASCPSMSK